MTNKLSITCLLLLVAALTSVSCVFDREACTDSSSLDKVQVKFTIAMDNGNTTRSTWESISDDNKQTGNYYENTIEVGKLQVLVYNNSTQKYIGKVSNTSYIRQEGTNNNTYDVLGDLPIDKSELKDGKTLDCMMVVLANYDSEVAPTTGDAITALQSTYTYDHTNLQNTYTGTTTDTKKYIPMWGVKHVSVSLTPGTNTDIGEIYMLRAMAKVVLTLDDAFAASYSIVSAKLTDSNTSGYVVPTTEGTFYSSTISAANAGTEKLDADKSFNPLAKTESTLVPVNFWQDYSWGTDGKIGDAVDNTYIVIVPEYKQGSTPATIKVTLRPAGEKTSDKDKEYEIELKKYENGSASGDALNLVRNSIYKYNITAIEGDKLNVAFTVAKWEHVLSQIGYDAQIVNYADFEIEAAGGDIKDATVGDIEAKYAFVANPSQKEYGEVELENKLSAARFQFKLTKPKGAVWYAYLTNEDDFYLSNGTYSSSQNLTATGIARDEYYYIQVNPRHCWYQPHTYTDSKGNTIFSDEYAVESNSGDYVYINGKFVKYDSDKEEHKNLTRYNFDYGVDSEGKSTIKNEDYAYDNKWETDTYGNSNTSVVSGPYTDLRIKISTDGVHYYDLQINKPDEDTLGDRTYYDDHRRFAIGNGDGTDGGDYYIRIWQVKSVSGATAPSYAKNNTKNETYKRKSTSN